MSKKLKFEVVKSNRGFTFYTFHDLYGSECRLSESSLATDSAIHFGVDTDFNGKESTCMHLSAKHVKQLIPILQWFVDHGYLPDDANAPKS